jgi:hypothetical protein
MIRNLKKSLLPIASAAALFFSKFYSVFADTVSDPSLGGIQGLENPLKVSTLAAFVQKVLEIVTTIGIPIVAIFIIYSGFLFVKAQGNPEELKTAKQTFLWTVVGAAILLASWILAKAICETVVQLGNTSTQCS